MNEFWHRLREECERLALGTELVTPVSERSFKIEATFEDRIVIQFQDSGEEQSLRREQFIVLTDSLEDDPISLESVPPGVEPYTVVLSLSSKHVSEDGTLSRAPDKAVGGESPHLVPPEEARTRPERIHDDAVLCADLLDRLDADDPASLDTEALADLYVLLSDVQRGADRVRKTVREPLLDRLGPDQQLHGRFGTVQQTTRERRRPKDEETVLDVLDEHGIPHEWVLGVDSNKLDVVLAVTDLSEGMVYDADEQVYVQKTGVDESAKFARLQGLANRLDEIEGGGDIHDDLTNLERRLKEELSDG
ncbi:hypothetical protein [Halocatena salina]|uniref:Uncharacterized protein n=1 Tax=Halocatena salina TaxID=2934340 RepID=A0A8U0A727_9EURY|nr:hypothetical protein [Halocatena salina]UPM44659.1 hypothetical protein MW046_16605 [Halocatena salina]